MHRSFRLAFLILICWAISAPEPSALAQPQDKGQQKCLTGGMKRGRGVTKAALKDSAQCIKLENKGNLPLAAPTAQLCLAADIKGKVSKARSKTTGEFTKQCGNAPDFAFTDADTLNDAHESESVATINDFFGVDLDAGLASGLPTDPKAGCAGALAKMLGKVEDTLHKEFERCVKLGLKNESIDDGATFFACLDVVKTDLRQKLSKATAKTLKTLNSKCPGGDLSSIFPGAVGVCGAYSQPTTAVGISECLESRELCRVCRIVNGAHGFEEDCDIFDDAASNGSCPDCPNGVVDGGESCDDGNTDEGDGCSDICTVETGYECSGSPSVCTPICGDSILLPGEDCDDGNTADGDCCGSTCSFEVIDSPCVGPPATTCTGPGCDGAGSCVERPANEGGGCDDADTCSTASECQSGECSGTDYVVTGQACSWAMVGPSSANNTIVEVAAGATLTGDICGDHLEAGDNAIIHGTMVSTDDAAADLDGADFGASVTVDDDIVTNNTNAQGGTNVLPDLAVAKEVPAGDVEPKLTSGFYDTTGTDPRVGECLAAQTYIGSTMAGVLDALASDFDHGAAYASIPGSTTPPTIFPVNVGGQNVLDFDDFGSSGGGGNPNITINLDGGGNPDTFFIMRIDNRFDTGPSWTWNLLNGLTPNHILWYAKGSGGSKCDIGDANLGGGGTVFCPNTKILLNVNSTWNGQLLGGDPGGGAGSVRTGIGATLTYTPFDAIIVP